MKYLMFLLLGIVTFSSCELLDTPQSTGFSGCWRVVNSSGFDNLRYVEFLTNGEMCLVYSDISKKTTRDVFLGDFDRITHIGVKSMVKDSHTLILNSSTHLKRLELERF